MVAGSLFGRMHKDALMDSERCEVRSQNVRLRWWDMRLLLSVIRALREGELRVRLDEHRATQTRRRTLARCHKKGYAGSNPVTLRG